MKIKVLKLTSIFAYGHAMMHLCVMAVKSLYNEVLTKFINSI